MPKKVGVKLYRRPETDCWSYYFRFNGKTYRKSTNETDRSKAEEVAYRARFEITKHKTIEDAGNISIQELLDKFLEHTGAEYRRETLKSYSSVMKTFGVFLNKRYPAVKLAKEITSPMIEEFKLERLRAVRKTTAQNNIKVVKTLFHWAIAQRLLIDNQAALVKNVGKKVARDDQTPIKVLTLEEFETFSDYAKRNYTTLYPLYMTYMYTGAREKELYALQWDDIDFNRKLIMIRRKDGFIPKTDERDLPLHDKLAEILATIPKKGSYVFLNGKKPFLYPDKDKKKGYYESHKPYRCLGKIMAAIGRPEFTRLHWLRHSFATIVAKKKGIKFAQEMLGHKDITVTERYVHYDRDYIQQNLNNIEELNRIFK